MHGHDDRLAGRAAGRVASGRPVSIDVRITGPAQDTVAVGSQITFQITVTNRGQIAGHQAAIKDRFDPGLEHKDAEGKNVIDRPLDDICRAGNRGGSPWSSASPSRAGCATWSKSAAADIVLASARPASWPSARRPRRRPGPTNLSPPPAGPAAGAAFGQSHTGPKQLVVGETARFFVEVTNKGTAPLRNVKVADRSDPALDADLATDGYRIENGVADVDHRRTCPPASRFATRSSASARRPRPRRAIGQAPHCPTAPASRTKRAWRFARRPRRPVRRRPSRPLRPARA